MRRERGEHGKSWIVAMGKGEWIASGLCERHERTECVRIFRQSGREREICLDSGKRF